MTRHLLTLVWNRKRTTLLVMVEIAAAFVVLTLVSVFAVYAFDNWRQPVGLEWEHVWDIEVDRKAGSPGDQIVATQVDAEGTPGAADQAPPAPAPTDPPPDPQRGDRERLGQLLLAVREFPEVELAATAGLAPFELGGMTQAHEVNGRPLEFGVNEVSDTFREVVGLTLTRGRWFGPEDTGQAYDAVVITEDLARERFDGVDPVGKPIVELDGEDLKRGTRPTRIVGVVGAYREDGEFDSTRNYALYRADLSGTELRRGRLPGRILIRVRPGTTAAFEQRLVERLQAAAPAWSFEVRTLAALRERQARLTLAPLAAVGVVAASLLLMVALGLLGVMWQSVTQRTREIGLRRAKGATRERIRRQILGEILVMTTLAVLPATVLLAQLPLFDVLGWGRPHVYVVALALSLVAIYVLAVFCGWYPARLATGVEPAEALRYE